MSETKVKKSNSLEGQFFEWETWDQVSTAEFHFYNCKLLKDVGSFKKDNKIQCIFFSNEKSKMEFYDENAQSIGLFDLEINVK